MNKTYLTSPNSGHYLMRYEDGDVLETSAGSEESGIRRETYLMEFYIEHPDYEIMNEEQFREWETKALMMRELIEVEDHEPIKYVR